ncbi:hypothetical protein ABZ297_15890 [Nonomuraea sp. NPDC005983]|uniref:hypothetical protein n=1 Tax=Nonomuraea sp. NPDC005983 TaxID=3155595 RepID=UPI0033B4EDCB
MTEQFLGVVGVAQALGLTRHAVHKWRARHPADSARPFPAPDVEVDGAPGWRAERVAEIARWRDGLPGRGAGGGRPSLALRDYLDQAATRGLDRDEAMRTLAVFVAEFPEMTEAQVAAWLAAKWRGLRAFDTTEGDGP